MTSRLRPFWILGAAWLVIVLYAYPGYMNWDADEQLWQLRGEHVLDWHPPIMAAYWRVLEVIVRGPFLMLVLQVTLFVWGLYAVLRRRVEPVRAAWLAAALALFPPVLTPMAVTWKDAQMAAFLIAGLALALDQRRGARAGGVVLLCLGAAVRDNGLAAVPPLCVLIAAAWGARRARAAIGIGAALTIAIGVAGVLANRAATDERTYPWYKTIAIHDIAGTICNDPSLSDGEIAAMLAPTGLRARPVTRARLCADYDPRAWFDLSFGDATAVFAVYPDRDERLARRALWWRLVRDDTGAFLAHRRDVFAQVLGLTDDPVWEPVCQTFAGNEDHLHRIHHDASLSWIQRGLGGAFSALAGTVLFRPWMYAVLGLVFLGWAAARRDGLIAALAGSGLLYELGYLAGAAAPDYRYSHWMVTCTCLCAVLIATERIRTRRARDASGGT